MPKFRVIGVRRAGGGEVDQVVDTVTSDNAVVMAQVAGVIVTGVYDESGVAQPLPRGDAFGAASSPFSQPIIVQTQPQRVWEPGIAALLSFFIPGAGQIYKGHVFNGLAWFVGTIIGYMMLVVPGVIMHVFCIVGAHSGDPTKRG